MRQIGFFFLALSLLFILVLWHTAFADSAINGVVNGLFYQSTYIPYCTPSFTCGLNNPIVDKTPVLTIYYPERQYLYIRPIYHNISEVIEYKFQGQLHDFKIEDYLTFDLNTGRVE